MKQLFWLVMAFVCLQSCKKHPHHPHRPCPGPTDCQLEVMCTTSGEASHNSGEPATPAFIVRDGSGKPVKYRGYATNFTRPTTNIITYSGNRMIFTDSARGFIRLEVWLNACGQPDSSAWYKPADDYGQYPANLRFHYNSAKQLTRFVAHIPLPHGVVPYEAHIQRDAHDNVTSISDGNHRTELTYDYARPVARLQWYNISTAFPEWAALIILDQLGMIGFTTSHLPKTLENWQGGYRFEGVYFDNWVLSGGKALSFDVKTHDPSSSDHGMLRYVLSASWACKGGRKRY